MGVRPTFYILIGIDDVIENDPRFTPPDPEWLEELLDFREMTEDEMWDDGEFPPFFDDYRSATRKEPGYSTDLNDVVFNPMPGSTEWRPNNIIGLITHRGPHDDEIIRALATINQKYLESGYERIPTLDPQEHPMLFRYYKYTPEDVRCNRFVQSYFENMPSISRMNWLRAQHYLRMVGWNVREDELRYLLVWNWS